MYDLEKDAHNIHKSRGYKEGIGHEMLMLINDILLESSIVKCYNELLDKFNALDLIAAEREKKVNDLLGENERLNLTLAEKEKESVKLSEKVIDLEGYIEHHRKNIAEFLRPRKK